MVVVVRKGKNLVITKMIVAYIKVLSKKNLHGDIKENLTALNQNSDSSVRILSEYSNVLQLHHCLCFLASSFFVIQ
jgi:hypothetical protein